MGCQSIEASMLFAYHGGEWCIGCLRNDIDLEGCCVGMLGTLSALKISVGIAIDSAGGKLGVDDQTYKQRF